MRQEKWQTGSIHLRHLQASVLVSGKKQSPASSMNLLALVDQTIFQKTSKGCYKISYCPYEGLRFSFPPLGARGTRICPFSAPLSAINFPKENGWQGQVVTGAWGDQRQKWRCLEWYLKPIYNTF